METDSSKHSWTIQVWSQDEGKFVDKRLTRRSGSNREGPWGALLCDHCEHLVECDGMLWCAHFSPPRLISQELVPSVSVPVNLCPLLSKTNCHLCGGDIMPLEAMENPEKYFRDLAEKGDE